MESEFLIIC